MVHIMVEDNNRTRHEYWEDSVYERHLIDVNATSLRPYYVCYTFNKYGLRLNTIIVDNLLGGVIKC